MATERGAAQIAAVLRARIMSGELAPGERVPSTRELTREWGVAMATATKALTSLRLEGLVNAVPGVGTMVSDAPTRAGSAEPRSRVARPVAEPTLGRDLIVETAVRIADAEGIGALSMRRVAAELGVATMSLYRHVADKDDLVVRMIDLALGEWEPPAPPPAGWRPRLELAGAALWAAFRAHPWLATATSATRPQAAPQAMAFTEWCLGALDGIGLSVQDMFDVQLMLFGYVRGMALSIDAEVEAQAATGLDNEEWIETQMPALRAIVSPVAFPLMTRLFDEGYDLSLDGLVVTGLRYLLDGLAVRIESPATLGGRD